MTGIGLGNGTAVGVEVGDGVGGVCVRVGSGRGMDVGVGTGTGTVVAVGAGVETTRVEPGVECGWGDVVDVGGAVGGLVSPPEQAANRRTIAVKNAAANADRFSKIPLIGRFCVVFQASFMLVGRMGFHVGATRVT